MVTNSTTFRASNLSQVEQEDAHRLKARFEALKSEGITQASFAIDFEMPGGASVISQHVKSTRPISIDQAKAYMRGFKCTLREISRKLADQVPQDIALSPENLQRQIDSLANVIGAIPEEYREQACSEALRVLTGFLPGAKRVPTREQ